MLTSQAFGQLCAETVGVRITHIWRGHGSAIFLEMGRLSPQSLRNGLPGNPRGEYGLSIEWSWRIQDERSIVCGSWSEEELWQSAFDRLLGSEIISCSLFGSLPEIELTTDSGLQLLSFSTTDGQPQWALADRRKSPVRWFGVKDGRLDLELSKRHDHN